MQKMVKHTNVRVYYSVCTGTYACTGIRPVFLPECVILNRFLVGMYFHMFHVV